MDEKLGLVVLFELQIDQNIKRPHEDNKAAKSPKEPRADTKVYFLLTISTKPLYYVIYLYIYIYYILYFVLVQSSHRQTSYVMMLTSPPVPTRACTCTCILGYGSVSPAVGTSPNPTCVSSGGRHLQPPRHLQHHRGLRCFPGHGGNHFLEFEQEENFTIFHLKEARPLLQQVPVAAFQNLAYLHDLKQRNLSKTRLQRTRLCLYT